MSNFMKKLLLLLLIFLNHVITACVLHWLIFNFSLIDLLDLIDVVLAYNSCFWLCRIYQSSFWIVLKIFLVIFYSYKRMILIVLLSFFIQVKTFSKSFCFGAYSTCRRCSSFYVSYLCFRLLVCIFFSLYKLLVLSAGINNFEFFFIFFTSLDSCI